MNSLYLSKTLNYDHVKYIFIFTLIILIIIRMHIHEYIWFRYFEISVLILFMFCFTSGSGIFRSYEDVTITGVELQNGGQWLEPTVFEQKRSSLWVTPDIFILGHTWCDTGPRFLWSHPKDRSNLVAFYDKHGVLRTYTYSTCISNGTLLCEKGETGDANHNCFSLNTIYM